MFPNPQPQTPSPSPLAPIPKPRPQASAAFGVTPPHSIGHFAALFGVAPRTIRNWIRDGVIYLEEVIRPNKRIMILDTARQRLMRPLGDDCRTNRKRTSNRESSHRAAKAFLAAELGIK